MSIVVKIRSSADVEYLFKEEGEKKVSFLNETITMHLLMVRDHEKAEIFQMWGLSLATGIDATMVPELACFFDRICEKRHKAHRCNIEEVSVHRCTIEKVSVKVSSAPKRGKNPFFGSCSYPNRSKGGVGDMSVFIHQLFVDGLNSGRNTKSASKV